MPGLGAFRTGFDGKTGWASDKIQGTRLMQGKELETIAREADYMKDVDPLRRWDKVETIGEGAFGAAHDDGAVGDGIGERHAEFDDVGAAAFEGGNEGDGGVERGIAGGDVGDEGGFVFLAQLGEPAANAGVTHRGPLDFPGRYRCPCRRGRRG